MKIIVNGRVRDAQVVLAERFYISEGRVFLIRDTATDDGKLQCQAARLTSIPARAATETNGFVPAHTALEWVDVSEGGLFDRLPSFELPQANAEAA